MQVPGSIFIGVLSEYLLAFPTRRRGRHLPRMPSERPFTPAPLPSRLYRTETAHYRDNLQTEIPLLWVILRPAEADPPYELMAVTADPAEGEGMTEAGANIVETVPMPDSVQEAIAAFVTEHHGGTRIREART